MHRSTFFVMILALVALMLTSTALAHAQGRWIVRYTPYYSGGDQFVAPGYVAGYGWYQGHGGCRPQQHSLEGWSGWYGTWGPRYLGPNGGVKAGAW